MSDRVVITRRVEFDAGHRVPSHTGKCRNVHGHRYALEAGFSGGIIQNTARSDDGMVADFSDLKAILELEIINEWDHAFIAGPLDYQLVDAMRFHLGVDTKIVEIEDGPPTVEILVGVAAHKIVDALHRYPKLAGVRLSKLRLYETPNCWADWRG